MVMDRLHTYWLCLCLALALSLAAGGVALACGQDSDCKIGGRSYRIFQPSPQASKNGAIVFAHGYRGSPKGAMGNQSLTALAGELDVAVIALDALGPDWNIPGVPANSAIQGVDELAYTDAVLADVEARFGLNRERLLATGFSAGGMMVWNLICKRSEAFAGFAPIAGTFWRPVPQGCEGAAANVIHIHGTSDRIVPLRGRPIANTHQGDVFRAMSMYAAHGGFAPAGDAQAGDLSCELRRNDDGRRLDLCLFDGGHSFRTEFIRFAWSELINAP